MIDYTKEYWRYENHFLLHDGGGQKIPNSIQKRRHPEFKHSFIIEKIFQKYSTIFKTRGSSLNLVYKKSLLRSTLGAKWQNSNKTTENQIPRSARAWLALKKALQYNNNRISTYVGRGIAKEMKIE